MLPRAALLLIAVWLGTTTAICIVLLGGDRFMSSWLHDFRAEHGTFVNMGAPLALLLFASGPLSGSQWAELMRAQLEQTGSRVHSYIINCFSWWVLAAVGWIICEAMFVSDGAVGIDIASTDPWIAVGIALGVVVGLAIKWRLNTSRSMTPEVELLIPQSPTEKLWWIPTAITAGVTEEFLFRGFLTFYLQALFPSISFEAALTLSTLAFGFAHMYQGQRGVLTTTLAGAVLAAAYWLTDTILVSVILHIGLNLAAGLPTRGSSGSADTTDALTIDIRDEPKT